MRAFCPFIGLSWLRSREAGPSRSAGQRLTSAPVASPASSISTPTSKGSGTIVVTEDSPRLRGTFSFAAQGMKSGTFDQEVVTVVDGSFDVPRVN
jgi:hypothetical protein